MTAPITTVRGTIKTALETEFASDGITILNDRLFRLDGVTGSMIGISPINEVEWDQDVYVANQFILIQCYRSYAAEANPQNRVDPAPIEDLAHRTRTVIRDLDGNDDSWFFRVVEVSYPSDPVGKASRFEAVVKVWGRNAGVIETTA